MTGKTQVLIVGGGPCGLAAACTLLRMGVGVRVLEAAAEPSTGSRAILLWPPTLESLRAVGVLDQVEELGFRCKAINYHLPEGPIIRVVLDKVNQPLILQQDRTNRLLEQELERLGGRVERSMRVTDIGTAAEDRVTAEVKGPDGTELIEAEWLIGADGVGSTVRERLGVEFPGTYIPSTSLLTEGRVHGGGLDRGEMHYLYSAGSSLVFVPLPGGAVRLSSRIEADTPLTPETVQRLLDAHDLGLSMSDLEAVTSFTSQERIAARYRKGRVFLVGDAAHTHLPLGGQGLNLGLQDVRNLVWKLAGVVQGRLDEAVLDTYDIERRHVAEETLKLTAQLGARFMKCTGTGAGNLLASATSRARNAWWAALQRSGVLRRFYAPVLAGWRVSYPDALFGRPAAPERSRRELRPRRLPGPGARTPHWVAEPGRDEAAARFRLLTTGGELASHAAEVAARRPDLVVHERVSLPRRGPGFLLLRPDGFVAASGQEAGDMAHAERLLGRLAA
ncbi:FAD-dependent monooxygenase [Streptomyces boninensis]|uniref:FAD-dependent monooxygenase n=1 Tax=Streptomyces boninensis TaxID=2039455 RepID=UPI003B218718